MPQTPEYSNGKAGEARRDTGPIAANGLNEFYLSAIKGMPRMRDALEQIIAEVNEKGVSTLQALDSEIMMQMVIIREAFEAMSRLRPEDASYERLMKGYRMEIDEHMETMRKLKETNNEFYYGSKYAVRLDQVHDFLKVVMQILLSEVKDAAILRRIAGKIDQLSHTSFKTEVVKVGKTIEVQNVANDKKRSGNGVGVDSQVAVGDDSGNPAGGGPDRNDSVPLSPEGAGSENKSDRPTGE